MGVRRSEWDELGLHTLEAKSSARPGAPKQPVRVRIGIIQLVNCCPVCGGDIIVRAGKTTEGIPAKVAYCTGRTKDKKCPWKAEVVEDMK